MLYQSPTPIRTTVEPTVTPYPAWLGLLRDPRTGANDLEVSAIEPNLQNGLPRNGYLVSAQARAIYDIKNSMLDLALPLKRSDLTRAGWSNHFAPTPQLYERLWRRRALTILTGEEFPVERELALVNAWTNLRPEELVIDLGTSTGLYARGLADTHATIFAVDLAWGMLREAQGYIRHEQKHGIVLLRAAAERLPFQDASMDAVVVGGSLNEMTSFERPLAEAWRVVRPGGRMFVMSLSKASRQPGRFLQALARRSGIQFPTVNEFNTYAADAGWRVDEQMLKRTVLFSLLVK